ncbi:hypothetical protein J3B02_000657, partial [Coemansia erecta]
LSSIKTLQIIICRPVDPLMFYETMGGYLGTNQLYDFCRLSLHNMGFAFEPSLVNWASVTWFSIDLIHFATLVDVLERMPRLSNVDVGRMAFDQADGFDDFEYPHLQIALPLCPVLTTLRIERFCRSVPLAAMAACISHLVGRMPELEAFITMDDDMSSLINPTSHMMQ